MHVLEARSVATWLSPSSCGGRAAAPAARPNNSTAKRRTRPPWYASASKHEVACLSATWPRPPVLAQVEAGTDCGRSWPRKREQLNRLLEPDLWRFRGTASDVTERKFETQTATAE